MKKMILGVSSPMSWDTSAALLVNGNLIAVAEEEKHIRVKHAPHCEPLKSIDFCLENASAVLSDIDQIAVAYMSNETCMAKRFLYGFRYLSKDDLLAPYYYALQIEHFEKLNSWPLLKENKNKIINVDHHIAHSFHAFASSEFDKSIVISLDGEGETVSGLVSLFTREGFQVLQRIPLRNSLGSMYEAFTEFIGYQPHIDEGKVMGLSSYGKPIDALVNKLVRSEEKCEFSRNVRKIVRVLQDFHEVNNFDGFDLSQLEKTAAVNYAATAQRIYENIVTAMTIHWTDKTGISDLCFTGGCSLNCIANGKLFNLPNVKRMYIPPASNDAGTSIGAASYAHYLNSNKILQISNDAIYGESFGKSENEVVKICKENNFKYKRLENIIDVVATELANGKIIGWFQEGIEFGPRALGKRSILASAKCKKIKNRLNDLKNRERWRPFGCIIKGDMLQEFFAIHPEDSATFKYMNFALPVEQEKADQIPGVVHVDGSCRVQTVNSDDAQLYSLLQCYYGKAGTPVLINTSLNYRGEPIVNTPLEALNAFEKLKLDYIVIENLLICWGN